MPRYSRAMPAEWPGLVEVALKHLGDGDISLQTVAEMYDHVDRLDDETLEVNKFYGMGLAMCGLVRLLNTPEVRHQLIAGCALNLAAFILRDKQGGEIRLAQYPMDVVTTQPMVGVTAYSASEMPKDSRFVTDTLSVVGEKRSKEHVHNQLWKDIDVVQQMRIDIQEGTATAKLLAVNALGATSIVTSRVARAMAEYGESRRPTASELVDKLDGDSTAFNEEFNRVVLRSAGLRLDEINGLSERLITMEDGHLKFNRDKKPKEPTQLPVHTGRHGSKLLHNDRLRCPSVNVTGLVPLIATLVPEIFFVTESVLTKQTDRPVTL